MSAQRGERWQAQQRGESRYTGGKPCAQCGGLLKYTASAKCVPCMHEQNAERRREKYRENPEVARETSRRWWRSVPRTKRAQWARNSSRRTKYNLEPDQFAALLDSQHGVCAICYEALRRDDGSGGVLRPVVDHDHRTGAVRGLLCDRCNHALGHLRDNAEIARRAALYLQGIRDYDA